MREENSREREWQAGDLGRLAGAVRAAGRHVAGADENLRGVPILTAFLCKFRRCMQGVSCINDCFFPAGGTLKADCWPVHGRPERSL